MGFEYRQGNLLDSGADALVNTVNCRGVMGAGLAKQFKDRYPRMAEQFAAYCQIRPRPFYPGEVYDFRLRLRRTNTEPPYVIMNVATKDDWRDPSELEWVRRGIQNLLQAIAFAGDIRTIAVPPLESGLGGLDWNVVRPLIEDAFRAHPTMAWIYGKPA